MSSTPLPRKDPPDRPDPRTVPSLIAWVGRATWREWPKITLFVILVIFAARLAGWS